MNKGSLRRAGVPPVEATGVDKGEVFTNHLGLLYQRNTRKRFFEVIRGIVELTTTPNYLFDLDFSHPYGV